MFLSVKHTLNLTPVYTLLDFGLRGMTNAVHATEKMFPLNITQYVCPSYLIFAFMDILILVKLAQTSKV